jgi:carbon-monoxide dehydrogenase medium subunit
MKPAKFQYECPVDLDRALELLAQALAESREAKIMAGGQSLIPMMNFRLVKPDLLIDVSHVRELKTLNPRPDGGLSAGALIRHIDFEMSELVKSRFAVIPEVMKHVAHLAVRNMGTIGGSLAHADPAAEWPMLARLLNAQLLVKSVRGQRIISAHDFFIAPLTTLLEPDEMLVQIEFPGLPDRCGCAFEEFARKPGDYALAAVSVVLQRAKDLVIEARIALMGIEDTPIRCIQAESFLKGKSWTSQLPIEAVQLACKEFKPRHDMNASGEYRRHLVDVMLNHTLNLAWDKALGPLK